MVDALHEKVKAEQEARMQRAIDNLEVRAVGGIIASRSYTVYSHLLPYDLYRL
jgi:hypothetical protein